MSAPPILPIPPIPSRTISHVTHATHEWRMLFALLEYFEGLPSQDARALWLDRLQSLRPALFVSLLQLLQLQVRADASGFMSKPVMALDDAHRRFGELTRISQNDV